MWENLERLPGDLDVDVQAGTTNSGLRKAFLGIYPFLLGYYPVFALRNHNIIYVDLPSILRTLLLVTAGQQWSG